jgi:hypothetical protein
MKFRSRSNQERGILDDAKAIASLLEIRKLRALGRADGLRIGEAFQRMEDVLHNQRAWEEFEKHYPDAARPWKEVMFPVYNLGFFEALPSGS